MTVVDSPLADALRDRYLVKREIGRGGMATVYLAHDLKHDRSLALKVLHPELAATLGPERFLREIKLTARLDHPHILPMLDSGEAAGQLWYTMPYVEGESLRDRIRRETQLPVDDALRIAREVADALDYAHRRRIIHRDIKPENILLSDGHARVADFGVARALEAAGGEGLTGTGLALGTPTYMSPEQASGGKIDGRSDLYALGCVVYEMLAGETPYTGPTPQAIITKRLLEPVPSMRRVRPAIPAHIDQIVTRALATVPADRYATAAEFARALAEAAVTPPTSAAPHRGPVAAQPGRYRLAISLAMLAAIVAGVLIAREREGRNGLARADSTMLAVLPFKNLGPPADEYFTEGLTEEITSRLASVSGLGVISRSSADQYKTTTKPVKQIGRELGASYVLEGRVRWERQPNGPQRIRVTPQLIRVSDDRHLWANRYDTELAGVFEVQTEIAEQVTKALGVVLDPSQEQRLATKPTNNLEAYDAYLRGNEHSEGRTEQDLRFALQLYDRAIALDPRFALAYTRRSVVHTELFASHWDRVDTRLAMAKADADTALRLQPDLAEAHLALAHYYSLGVDDPERALREYNVVRSRQPNNAELVRMLARMARHQGEWDSAVAGFRRALRLDPRSVPLALSLVYTLRLMRMFAEADRVLDTALARSPDDFDLLLERAFLQLAWRGDLDSARALAVEAVRKSGVEQVAYLELDGIALVAHDEVHAHAIEGLPVDGFGADTAWYYFWKAEWYHQRRKRGLARAYSDSARQKYEAIVRARPEDAEFHHFLASAYAGLDRKEDAIREAQKAVELLPVAEDAVTGAHFLWTLAFVYTRVGEADAAVDQLVRLLTIPSVITTASLRADPTWDALRSNPQFQRLLQGKT